jgi:L-threonylcarbamoyladenylate synthase
MIKDTVVDSTDQGIERGADLIKRGDVVAFPTETVYGLGADATNGNAVAKIFEVKGRPRFNPLISHFSDMRSMKDHVVIPPLAEELMLHFWPGPLTLILNKKKDSSISSLVSAGLETLAVRVPSHPVARALIDKAGVPIAAPSANVSGNLSPTTAQHVEKSLSGHLSLILAGGKSESGLESTIVDARFDKPVVLRLGGISPDELAKVSGLRESEIVLSLGNTKKSDDETSPMSPGQLLKHYAPSKPLRMNVSSPEPDERWLTFGSVVGRDNGFLNLSEKGDLYEAASNLFTMLHEMDTDVTVKKIAVAPIPDKGVGLAINDRLHRASQQ